MLRVSLLVACLIGPAGALASEPIRIGLVGPLTGPAANTGLTVRSTWELVARRVNAVGGLAVDGTKRPIEVIAADSQSKPAMGVSAAQKLLTRDHVDIIVGDLLHSDVALALMELAPAYRDKLFYVPLPTSSSISARIAESPEKYGSVWKWNGDSESSSLSIADYLKTVPASGKRIYPRKTYAIVSELTDFGTASAKAVQSELDKAGWVAVAHETVPLNNADFYPVLTKLKSEQPEVVFSIFTAANTGIAYIKQFREQQLASENIAIYYAGLPGFRNGIGKDGNGLIFFGGGFDAKQSERGRAFAKLLTENNINVSYDAALGYCSANVLVAAIERAQTLSIDSLNREMAATDDDTCPDGRRIVFDANRHSPKLGPDYFFMAAAQLYRDGTEYIVFYPPKAATGKLDEFPASPAQ